MEQEVSQFVPEPGEIVPIESIDCFIRLLDQVVADGAMRLAPIPGAFAAQTADDRDKPDEISGRNGRKL